MLHFIKHKLLNKKWLNLCLLTGIILLVAVFSCSPMFEKGSLDKLLQKSFNDSANDSGEYPLVLYRNGFCETKDYPDSAAVYGRLDAYESKWNQYIDVDKIISEQLLKAAGGSAAASFCGSGKYLDIMLIRDMDAHIDIVKGENLSDGLLSDGTIPCIISESVMDEYGLVVGEKLSFDYNVDSSGNPACFTVVGIFAEKAEDNQNFWYKTANSYSKVIFTNESGFDYYVENYQLDTVSYEDYMLLDYTGINSKNAMDYMYYIEEFTRADSSFGCNFYELLSDYSQNAGTVKTILFVIELPVCVLLLAFVYMVSKQILGMETVEIAMLNSRGVSPVRIVGLYVLQSAILAFFGCIIGIPLAYFMCRMAAGTDAFLKFSGKDVSVYQFTPEMLIFALIAGIAAILFMSLPVLRLSRLTVADKRESGGKPFWEKCFLDVILLCISSYLLYNYYRQSDSMALDIISGDKLDPMVFLDSSLFIFATGLLLLRLIKYLVRFIYFLGKKRWKPAMYASFLTIMRTSQGFISVFLVMTVAMGIFNANMARTVNENNEERLSYDMGADVVSTENWRVKIYKPDRDTTLRYYEEPDFERYENLVDAGICQSVTRVMRNDDTELTVNSKKVSGCTLMAVNTREFGETARLKSGLNDTHWFNALNALSQNPEGVIISKNLADEYGVKVGDSISYRYFDSAITDEEDSTAISVTVCAIVNAWPGFDSYAYTENEDGEILQTGNYLLVANYAGVVDSYELTPYSVWMRLADGKTVSDVESYLEEEGVTLSGISSISQSVSDMKDSAQIQITNGMFTISFIISVLLCTVGYLIYWIMSIKNRESIFGVYRAMGMTMKEINRMLVNEQIFASLLSVLAGVGVGIISTRLFVKLLALVYLPEKHNIALEGYIASGDMLKLVVIFAMVFVICLTVLRRLVKDMKIVHALKLGEDERL
jgi:putative ABC transport system permease protein